MPDGEICTCPVEDSVNGKIRFTYPGIYNSREVENIYLEFNDGKDYAGDNLNRIELWRSRFLAVSERGHEFNIAFELSDDAFTELREYLKVLLRSDCFRE